MDQAEGIAGALRRAAGVAADEAVLASEIAVRLGVEVHVISTREWRHAPALARCWSWRDERHIDVCSRSGARFREFLIAHELVEFEGHRLGVADPEVVADRGAGALMAPAAAFRRAAQAGLTLDQLANAFHLTRSGAALRIGEATRRPVALVTPYTVRRRGEPIWPEDATLRAWTVEPPPSVERLPIREGPARSALAV